MANYEILGCEFVEGELKVSIQNDGGHLAEKDDQQARDLNTGLDLRSITLPPVDGDWLYAENKHLRIVLYDSGNSNQNNPLVVKSKWFEPAEGADERFWLDVAVVDFSTGDVKDIRRNAIEVEDGGGEGIGWHWSF